MTPRMHDPSMNTTAILSERHAALIVESAIDYAIVGLDVAGVITSWNEGARRIMGWNREEAIGRHVELFFTPEDRTDRIADAEMRAALRHGRGIDERWHLRKDDTRFWANGEMMPLVSADGNHEGYVKILRDRTEQHDAAAALSESEDRYRSLYDAIDEGFCLIEVRCDDTARPIDFRFLEVNAAFERQTGIVDAPGSWMRDIAPDHEQYWFDVYAKVALTGEPVRFTLPAQALNGRWYEVFAYRVGEPTDRQVAILFSDISERRSREARLAASDEHLRTANATLRDSEANLRRLIDTIDEGFYAVDRDGVTTMCNAAFLKMLGFAAADDVVGRKLHDLIHHSHPDGSAYAASECPIYIAASTGRAAHVVEEQFFPLEGPPVWVEYRATPVVRGGELQGAICTFQNINARRDSERQRAKAERRRTAILDLGDRLRNITDIAEMGHVAGEIIGKALNADGAGYGRIEGSGAYADIVRDWAAPGLSGLSGRHAMRDFGSYVDDLIRGDVVVIEDAHADPRTATNVAAWSAIGIGALVNVPIVEMASWSRSSSSRRAKPGAGRPARSTSFVTSETGRAGRSNGGAPTNGCGVLPTRSRSRSRRVRRSATASGRSAATCSASPTPRRAVVAPATLLSKTSGSWNRLSGHTDPPEASPVSFDKINRPYPLQLLLVPRPYFPPRDAPSV